ncbi:hypothetical protein EJ06DRAFT_264787 [Trichodelitschia bisporula]|uniref:GAG-pre-integrase domain-containing protein n=1 Tax=Trichodelitschia bisporula TaxID=703511 RepID=A0A6G1HHZ5_9PEZI|nr:hypothetical protein EJ06DRAFT_264787 [Trichodelitschia bisporula]
MMRLNCNTHGRKVQLFLEDALFCPDMGANLISASQILRGGSKPTMTWTKVEFLGPPPLTVSQECGLFLLDLWEEPVKQALLSRKDGFRAPRNTPIPAQPSAVSRPRASPTYRLSDPNMLLWHDRMGHLCEQNFASSRKCPTACFQSRKVASTSHVCLAG